MSQVPTLTITRGLPGSGKSTWARAYVAEDPAGRARVNRDDLRGMLHDGVFVKTEFDDSRQWLRRGTESAVQSIRDATVRKLLQRGLHVVCDDTNLPNGVAEHLAKIAAQVGAYFAVQDFRDVPLEVCLERNAARGGQAQVAEDVIREMHGKYIAGEPDESAFVDCGLLQAAVQEGTDVRG